MIDALIVVGAFLDYGLVWMLAAGLLLWDWPRGTGLEVRLRERRQ